ncbi:hypothetical protein NKR23_g3376 [Pleurostoma richardsiae]|uniref:Uncharacterized protein n=1 Tax=Pleurostoma richardsiae TaxID=41990 RepID=A0AA38VTI9_9PEZI|nr:hypothetical protein NKR23_g3376 [Pleurostoma richardsiae]
MEDIFLDLFLEEAPRDDDSVVDPAIYPADAHAKFERYDRSHPWVQEILERIPKLEMKAMVEFCDVDRAVTEKQSHQGDNHPVAMSLTGR